MRDSFVLDTSILVEYLDLESPFRDKVERLFSKIKRGEMLAYVCSTTLGEILYVASRIYREAGSEDPNGDAMEFSRWILDYLEPTVIRIDEELSMRAGEIRKRARISFLDCIVLAAGAKLGASPLFLKMEREMRKILNVLREYGAVFLSDLEL